MSLQNINIMGSSHSSEVILYYLVDEYTEHQGLADQNLTLSESHP